MPVQTITKTVSAVSTKTKIIATAVAVAALGGIAAGLTPMLKAKPELQIRPIIYSVQQGSITPQIQNGIDAKISFVNSSNVNIPGTTSTTNISMPIEPNNSFLLSLDLLDKSGKKITVTSREIYYNYAANPDFVLVASGSNSLRLAIKNELRARSDKSIIITLPPALFESKGLTSIRATIDSTNYVKESNERNNTIQTTIPENFRVFRPDYAVTDLQISQNSIGYAFTLKYKNIGLVAGQGWVGLSAKNAAGSTVTINSDMITFDGYAGINDRNQSTQFAAVRMPDTLFTDEKTLTGTILASLQKSGASTITAQVDITNDIPEINEANNEKTFTLPSVDTIPPTVISTSPAADASDVATGYNITAVFSELLDLNTVLGTNVYLAKKDTPATHISGTVTFNQETKTLIFHPNQIIAGGTSYTFTITTGVKDVAGNSLAANKVWSFATAFAPGTLRMSLSSDTPTSDTLNAGTDSNVMTLVEFTATGETFFVQALTVTNDTSKDDDNLYKSVTIKYKDNNQTTREATASFVNGSASFSGQEIFVVKDGKATVSLIGNINSMAGGARSGQTTLLGVDGDANFKAIGWSSNYAIDQSAAGIVDVNGNTFTFQAPTQGTLNFSLNASSPSGTGFVPSSNTEVIRFNIVASTNAVTTQISDIRLNLTATDMGNSNWICGKNTTITVYDVNDLSTNLNGTALEGTGCAVNTDTTTYFIPLARSIEMAPGSSKTFMVRMNTDHASTSLDDTLRATIQNIGYGYSGETGPSSTGIPIIGKDILF